MGRKADRDGDRNRLPNPTSIDAFLDWAARTFLRKLTVSVCLLVLLTAALVGYVASRVARTHLTEELALQIGSQARLLRPNLPEGALRRRDSTVLDTWADRMGEKTDMRVTVTDRGGRVLGDSEVPLEALPSVEGHAGRPEIRRALAEGQGSAMRRSRTIGIDLLYVAVPVGPAGAPSGTLRLAMPLSIVEGRLTDLRTAIVLASLLCLLIALPLSILVLRSIHQPVQRLAAAAERISRGDFSARAGVDSKDELGRLSNVLDSMAERIAAMVGELSADKAQLETTLDNMVEAVALLDSRGRIEELNHVMEELLKIETARVRGRLFHEVFPHSSAWDLLEKTIDDKEPCREEVSLGERLFEGWANPILEGGALKGVVLALHDITRLRRLEEVRKEFVANVSHELRTPLSHIKASAETLRRGGIDDPENRMDFIGAIEDQADGMTRLVDELLDLAEIESGKRELRTEPILLGRSVEEAIASLASSSAGKGVRMENRIDGELRVRGDSTALRQILVNLLDNAIKYNRQSGTVQVEARENGSQVEVSVSDSGVGIPRKEIARLFERFYRVDKARSRELGGTGLGLSIVKHLVESMGGKVWAESAPGTGSIFRFTLPS